MFSEKCRSISKTIFFCALVILGFFTGYLQGNRENQDKIIELKYQNSLIQRESFKIRDELSIKNNSLKACLQTVVGEGGFVPMYERIDDTVYRIVMDLYSETESGEPNRFIMECARQFDEEGKEVGK